MAGKPRWSRWAFFGTCLLIVLATAGALAVALPNQPMLTVTSPAPGSVTEVWNGPIAVGVSDSVAISSPATVILDGRSYSVPVTFAEVGGHWEGDGCDAWWVADYDYTRGTLSYAPGILSDGTHETTVTARDSAGSVNSIAWSFRVQAPPKVTAKSPGAGVAVGVTRPTISATLADNGSIAGAVVKLDGSVLGSTWNAAYKTVSATPAEPLADGTHAVSVVASDTGGLTSTTAWEFVVATTPTTRFSAMRPGSGETTSTWSPTISVECTDSAVIRTITMKVDGTPVVVTPNIAVGGHTAVPTARPTMLTDGLHRVDVVVTNDLGFTSTHGWSFTVQAPPQLSGLAPAAGGWSTSLRPTVSGSFSDNGGLAAAAVTVDGVIWPTSIDPIGKSISASAPTTLSDDVDHAVSMTATDVSGNQTSRTWSFKTHSTPPAFSKSTPAPAVVVAGRSQLISVDVYDAMSLRPNPVMYLDGVKVASGWQFVELEGHWEGDGCDAYYVATYDYTRGTASFFAPTLSNGEHTVTVQATNAIGGTSTHEWRFTVAEPPLLSKPSPVAGTVTPSTAPEISVAVGTNAAVASTFATIDGMAVASAYDPIAKVVRITPALPLADDCLHTVFASTTDVSGLTGSLTWSFTTHSSPPVVTEVTPGDGSSIAVASPSIKVQATDAFGMGATGSLTLDGNLVSSAYGLVELSGRWVGDGCDAYYEVIYDPTRAVMSYQAPPLPDGPHTAVATVRNTAGLTRTKSWTFSVAAPPVVSAVWPLDGSWMPTTTPAIYASVSDNGAVAAVSMTVDGVPVACSYDPVLKRAVASLSAPLANDVSHPVTLLVTDSVGATSFKTWSFTTHVAGPVVEAITPESETDIWDPVVSARLSDASGLRAGARMWVDGAEVPSVWEYDIISQQWVGDGCDSWLETVYDYNRAKASYHPTSLSDGLHTVRITALNNAGTPCDRTWSFMVQAPPQLSQPSPAPDVTVSTRTPQISLSALENSGIRSIVATVSGELVAATHDPATNRITLNVGHELENDVDQPVSVQVTDQAGNVTTLLWTFHVQTYPDMPGTLTQPCESCHVGYPALHPMGNCNACHGAGGPVEDCRSCHGYWNHGPSEFGDSDWSGPFSCTRCHQPAYASNVPSHPEDSSYHDTSRDMTQCRPCHVAPLATEHYRRTDDSGQPLTCASCHQSADPAVRGAIAQGNTDCATCHSLASQGHQSVHIIPAGQILSPYGVTCSACHAENLVDEHARQASSSAALSCDACHPSPRQSLASPWNGTCVVDGCHVSGSASAMHGAQTTAHTRSATLDGCVSAGCHASDLAEVHLSASLLKEGVTLTGCLVCHGDGVVPEAGTCTGCHTGIVHEGANHTVGAPCANAGCHDPDVSRVHARPGCAACHASGKTPSLACAGCHPADPHVTAGHTSRETCVSCHDVSDIASVHGDDCTKCHPNPRASFTTWDGTCEQAGCHAVRHAEWQASSWKLEHDQMNAEFGAGSCWLCHRDECDTCHSYDRTPPVTTSDLRSSYTAVAVINLSAVDGGSAAAPAIYHRVDGGPILTGNRIVVEASAENTHTIEYWSQDAALNSEVHRLAEFSIAAGVRVPPITTSDALDTYVGTAVINLSAEDFSSYGISKTVYVLDGGAETIGTAVTVPAPQFGYQVHTLRFWSVDNADNVEPAKSITFTVRAPGDTLAPVTTSNALSVYTGTATINLTASDSGSGVAKTLWRLDGGPVVEGTTIAVPPPASGSGSHAIQFWSVDRAGNVESTKTKSFSVNSVGTGTVRFTWMSPPAGAYTYYYIYQTYGGVEHLVASHYNVTGVWETQVPVTTIPYRLSVTYLDPDYGDEPYSWSTTAYVRNQGALVDWWY